MRVFVSSTVYDLIDIRAEVLALLDELGVTPVMSDYASSGFRVVPDANSVEACIENLKVCDAVIVILSQRYGPPLHEVLSYLTEPLSATHYEYRAARENGKPIFFYARDKLLAEWKIWRLQHRPADTSEIGLSWTPVFGFERRPNASRLFAMLDEHASLHDESRNWVTPFTDSIQLKQSITDHLEVTAKRLTFARRVKEGQIPEIILLADVRTYETGGAYVDICISNVKSYAALRVHVCGAGDKIARRSTYVAGGERWPVCSVNLSTSAEEAEFVVTYEDAYGCGVRDRYELRYAPSTEPAAIFSLERVERRFSVLSGETDAIDVLFD